MTVSWIAHRLQMGVPSHLTALCFWFALKGEVALSRTRIRCAATGGFAVGAAGFFLDFGDSAGKFFNTYDEIPEDCWESRVKPLPKPLGYP